MGVVGVWNDFAAAAAAADDDDDDDVVVELKRE